MTWADWIGGKYDNVYEIFDGIPKIHSYDSTIYLDTGEEGLEPLLHDEDTGDLVYSYSSIEYQEGEKCYSFHY